MLRKYQRSTILSFILAAACLGTTARTVYGQSPLSASDFTRVAPHGFGDRQNSWAQSMIWWKGNLYVGTSRSSLCGALWGVHLAFVGFFGQSIADTYLPYPPPDPDLVCAPDAADLPLPAEIWRWSPVTSAFSRVYQSPNTLPNPGIGPPAPPRTGKFLPYEVSFRGFSAFKESDGTEALYAFSINATGLWYRGALPPPRILRTTDGVNWTPVPQAPGTFLGDLPFNPDHSSFRSPEVYDGRLFVLSGPLFGQGSLIATANPSQGNNAWFLAEPANMLFYELQSFNGWLYIGGFDPANGYAVFKTKAQGSPPYPLTMVVPPGAGLLDRPSKSVVSMFVHNNRLYVGTATFPEIVRINPDDTWDLVMGSPRVDPVTHETKYPLSNLDAGFGHTLNDHVWYQDDPYNFLYAGTYNATTGARNTPLGSLLLHNMGAHLYRTFNDWYYSPVTTNGFAKASDPQGGKFDFGIRTMVTTPYGMFIGTANDHFGTQIFRSVRGPFPIIDPPGNLEVEPSKTGAAMLSWLASTRGATSYQVWRAERLPILLRDDLNFENWNGVIGNKVPDIYVGPYQLIGTTPDLFYIDSTVQAGHKYMYYVLGAGANNVVSQPSSLVSFPLLLPPVTFAQLLGEVNKWVLRGRFIPPDPLGSNARQQLLNSQAHAAACQINAAIADLNPAAAAGAVLNPDSADVSVLFNKLVRRLQLFNKYPTQVQSTEFCP